MELKEMIENCTTVEELDSICGQVLQLQELLEEVKPLIKKKMKIINPEIYQQDNLSHLFLEYSVFSQLSKNKLT